MRLRTRQFLAGTLLVAGLIASGCAVPGRAPSATAPATPLRDKPRRAGYPAILVAMPEGEAFQTARHAIVTELSKKFDFVTQTVDSRTTPSDLLTQIEYVKPLCMILMDNSSVALLRALQRQRGPRLPPSVVLMAAFLQDIKGELTNIEGVVYEVPGVTAFVQLRSIVAKPVNRIGVIHRPAFARFVERERALAAKEQIALVSEQVPRDPSPSDITRALDRLREANIDALWILNDIGLIKTQTFLEEAWLDAVGDLRVPVVVNVQTLVDPRLQFGTLAVVPDHEALGVQAANMVLDLADAGWTIKSSTVELPTSTITIVDMTQLNTKFEIRKDAQKHIDKSVH
ncbi:MAG TPA: hypothetical protein VJT73_03875 [Polyangiaceae bacterium]|nr:hypothetical protein [Polyangiaceae bacterium]